MHHDTVRTILLIHENDDKRGGDDQQCGTETVVGVGEQESFPPNAPDGRYSRLRSRPVNSLAQCSEVNKKIK